MNYEVGEKREGLGVAGVGIINYESMNYEVGGGEVGRPLRAHCGGGVASGGVGRWGSCLITLSPQNPITLSPEYLEFPVDKRR